MDMEFAISHLLREMGFHKESDSYFIKPNVGLPVKKTMRKDNFWHFTHYDFNRYGSYKPSFGRVWNVSRLQGVPIFQPYEKEGYLCTCPSWHQVSEFCMRRGIRLRDITSPRKVLEDLVEAYRKKSRSNNAFRKYVETKKMNL